MYDACINCILILLGFAQCWPTHERMETPSEQGFSQLAIHSRTALTQVILMSATLDSNLLAHYFGDCQTLAAGGRTHPVQQFFLEDIYDFTGYRLDAEGPASLKHTPGSALQNKALKKASTSKQKLVQVEGFLENILHLETESDHLSFVKLMVFMLTSFKQSCTWSGPLHLHCN